MMSRAELFRQAEKGQTDYASDSDNTVDDEHNDSSMKRVLENWPGVKKHKQQQQQRTYTYEEVQALVAQAVAANSSRRKSKSKKREQKEWWEHDSVTFERMISYLRDVRDECTAPEEVGGGGYDQSTLHPVLANISANRKKVKMARCIDECGLRDHFLRNLFQYADIKGAYLAAAKAGRIPQPQVATKSPGRKNKYDHITIADVERAIRRSGRDRGEHPWRECVEGQCAATTSKGRFCITEKGLIAEVVCFNHARGGPYGCGVIDDDSSSSAPAERRGRQSTKRKKAKKR